MTPEGANVLIIEDDVIIAEMVQQLLQTAGYTVEHAEDSVDAVLRLAEGDYDLILLDVMLPGLDGRELCRCIRAHDEGVYVPIIMLTALSSEADRHAGFAAGADDYVSKPFDAAELLDRVAAWVHARMRLKATHARLLAQQAELRRLEQQALRDRLAQDEAVLAMARTASYELNQPLTLLLGVLELWESGYYGHSTLRMRRELQGAATDLAARVERLAKAVRYETTEMAGLRVLDLIRAQRPDPASAPETDSDPEQAPTAEEAVIPC